MIVIPQNKKWSDLTAKHKVLLVLQRVVQFALLATAFPLAYMFERDNNTIWAPALLHGAAHSIKLVSIPDGVFPTAALIWFAVVPFLVFAFPKRFFAPGSRVARHADFIDWSLLPLAPWSLAKRSLVLQMTTVGRRSGC